MIRPGTAEFQRLSIFDKHAATVERLQYLVKPSTPDEVDERQDLEQLEHAIRWKATLMDPVWDMEHNLWLADKNSKDTLFKPYKAQKRLISMMLDGRDKISPVHPYGRPVRIYMPKTRRIGGSQAVAAVFYEIIRNEPNTAALVMAHDAEASKEIFSKYRRFWDRDPFRPDEERSSSTEMAFKNTKSFVSVRTAGTQNASVGHAFGFKLCHLSECARYRTPDPNDLITGILATMPPPTEAWTCAVLESTGNGVGDWFYDAVMELYAIENGDLPSSEHQFSKLLFLPAFERHDARLPFLTDSEQEKFVRSMTDEELAIFDNYRGDTPEKDFLEFLHWYRYIFENEIKGANDAEKRRKRKEQHPLTVHDCFQSSGGNAFDHDQLDKLLKAVKQPVLQGRLESESALWDGSRYTKVTPVPKFRKSDSGPLQVFARPLGDHGYSLGVDVARGLATGDWSVIMVFDRTSRKFVARFRDKMGVAHLINQVRLLSRWYNDAVINVEVNFDSSLVEDLMETDRRQFMCMRKNPTGVDVRDAPVMQYGWHTTNKNKVQLVSLLREKLEYEPSLFTDPLLLHEMRTFQEVYNLETKNTKFEAAGSNHDDVLIAAALALVADQDSHKRPPADGSSWKPKSIKQQWEEFVERQQAFANAAIEGLEYLSQDN